MFSILLSLIKKPTITDQLVVVANRLALSGIGVPLGAFSFSR